MLTFLISIILVSLASSFLIRLCSKWGLFTYLALKGNEFLNKLVNCTSFCVPFWASVVVSILLAIFFWDVRVLACPIFATPIICRLI